MKPATLDAAPYHFDDVPRPAPARPRVLWLAVSDGRGHLMRAQLMRQLLGKVGVDVDIVTTADDGAAFVASFGAPCAVLSRDFGIHFDGQQNLRNRVWSPAVERVQPCRECGVDVGQDCCPIRPPRFATNTAESGSA